MTPEQERHFETRISEIEDHIEDRLRDQYTQAKPKWYQVNLAQGTTVLTVILGMVIWFVQGQNKLNNLEVESGHMKVRIDLMDQMGTAASKQTIALDHQIIMSHETRLTNIEDFGTKIAVMQAKIDRIYEDLKEMRNHKGPPNGAPPP